jgi:hypothetical protein
VNSASHVFRAYSLHLLVGCCAFLLISNLSYGDLIGTYFDYSNINEFFTPSPDLVHSFGTPSVNGNTLTFQGPSFSSTTSGLNTVDFLDGRLEVTISAHPGYGLTDVSLYENGAYHYNGPFGGINTTAEVDLVAAQLQITEIAGNPVNLPPVFGTMVFSPQNLFQKTVDATPGTWEGTMTISIANQLANTQYAGQLVTKAVLRFNNVLTTSSDAEGAYAFIDKKTVQITTEGVPEPGVLVMLATAVLGLGLWLRNKWF